MKQTAVEWLYDEIKHIIPNDFLQKFEQAKAMEKEQINKNTNFICHCCRTKHTGENDDQMYEVCKKCFINL